MEDNLPNGNQVLNGDGDDDDDDDPEMNYIQLLLERETTYTLNDQQAAVIINDIWIQEARNHALRWILRTSWFLLPFRVRTVSMSMIYLNRSFARRRIGAGMFWTVRLLAITCLALSAQMDEARIYLPQLSEYEVGDYDINVDEIGTMMLIVLNELNWDMNVVTPFPFASFILTRFNRQISEATRNEIAVLILMALKDVRLMTQRSSVMAAAAILLAVNNNLTRQQLEIEIFLMPLYGSLDNDNVWYCYNRLRELSNRLISE